MNPSEERFCRLYRPIGALLLLLAILFFLLRSCTAQKPVVVVPAVEATSTALPAAKPTVAPPTALPTAALTVVPPTALPTVTPPTASPVAVPRLNLPASGDYTPDGVRLTGTGQPGATVELWEGATKIGTAVVGVDGIWTLVARLSQGTHKIAARTADAAGKTVNETPALDITVPAVIVLPLVNVPAAADYTADGVKLTGTGQPGATIELWDGATRIGVAVVGADGIWSVPVTLGEGPHKISVRTVDAAGNVLNELPALEITAPAAIAVPVVNVPAAADYTADGVKLAGTGQPGATVELWDSTAKIGTAVVGADGTWSLLARLGEGAHTLAALTVDAAGSTVNHSPALDVTVPSAQAPATGQVYIVQPGDWLMNLARRFYGSSGRYTRIIDGTNAMAAVDSSFATITNPNSLVPGQKLWIPATPFGTGK